MKAEEKRLNESRNREKYWKRWGCYLSERAWGTVREDYSPNGSAWDYFPFEHANKRAFRWNEDGIAGICDRKQRICFSLAFWNENDEILKERLFGLAGPQGNHGEDVKEYYYYLDSTPTHSYMKYLYKYPQAEFPYEELKQVNANRPRTEPEFELIDTGVFADNKYFDVFVEYAKADYEDICVKITVFNRAEEAAPLHVLPTIWFRNCWSWDESVEKPGLRQVESSVENLSLIELKEEVRGEWQLTCEGSSQLLFTENETNLENFTMFRMFPDMPKTALMILSSKEINLPLIRSKPERKLPHIMF
ncbi:MAG: hypothetical protein HC846_05545 [Blastocatellia bacterium]|nr:hypothetical protein [Blastocatellia bacterium]